jgi:hypothetical protein
VLAALAQYAPVYEIDNQGHVMDLKLEGRQVVGQALRHASRLSALRRLSLYGAQVDDESLRYLQTLKHLEALGLGATPVTDRGLQYLAQIPSLSWLWVSRGGKVTEEGVRRLRESLPGLVVYWQ